jgi:UDP-N-acetyl-D-glucosamine dehydrogenase
LAGEVNSKMPQYVVGRLADELDRRFQRGLHGSKILLVGLAYKKNVDDLRGSPSLKLLELLEARGSAVDYTDPFIARIPINREHPAFAGRTSVGLSPETIAGYAAVVIVTDHDSIDYQMLVDHAPLVVDARNACAHHGVFSSKVAKA